MRSQDMGVAASPPWQPWERNFSGGRIGVQQQQGLNKDWTVLHVESGGVMTTTSMRDHEAWDLALMLSPALKARLDEMFTKWRAAADANHALTYRACDTDLLRSIADERDCGHDCDHARYGPCRLVDRGECGYSDAEQLRELAKGIDLANATLLQDLLCAVDSCGGTHPAGEEEYGRGFDAALVMVEGEIRKLFAHHASAIEAQQTKVEGAQDAQG